jgi:lysine 6-dehydrogenase
MRILVLGAGRMGLGAVYDLVHQPNVSAVTVADMEPAKVTALMDTINSDKLMGVTINAADYGAIVALMRSHDAAISCVVYRHNLSLAKAAIDAKAHFCDLGGNNSIVDAELALDEKAKEAGINIIPDCGLAPGMVSILAMYGAEKFDTVDSLKIRVGGLPQDPQPPLNYQIVFSVEGLINEYIEKARVIRDGQICEVESLTELETLDFPPYGQLEAFQTSGGTSTLPDTFQGRVRNLDYKTIRYLGHCEKFRLLVDLGLCHSRALSIDGLAISPRRVLGELLVKRFPTVGPDLVLVRLEFVGQQNGKTRKLRYDIVDKYDPVTGLSAMMRTTAFPAAIIAQMMAAGEMTALGALPQERCVPADKFVAELAKRNIQLQEFWDE